MSEGEPPSQERRPPPTLLWLLLALAAIAVFAFAMWALNPPAAGVGRPAPDVIVPTQKPGG